MAKADTWMPFYIADYLRATMHLSRDEHGAYMLLIMAAWESGGRLPNRPRALAGIVKATLAEWEDLAPSIMPFFEIDGDELVSPRVVEEREKAQRLSDARREVGSKGGRPKKQTETEAGSKEKPIGFANANLDGLQTETPSPSPILEPNGSKISEANASVAGSPSTSPAHRPPRAFTVTAADVDAIWAATPKIGRERSSRKDLDRALRAAASRGQPPTSVRGGVIAYYASEQATKSNGEFAKGVHRIVENDRWQTFVETAHSAESWTDDRWRAAVALNQENGGWSDKLGPKPGEPGCKVPAHILHESAVRLIQGAAA